MLDSGIAFAHFWPYANVFESGKQALVGAVVEHPGLRERRGHVTAMAQALS